MEESGEHEGNDEIERVLQEGARDWGDDGSQTNEGSIDGYSFIHEKVGGSIITNGRFVTDSDSGKIQKNTIKIETDEGKKEVKERFLKENYNKDASVGSRIDFEMVIFLSGKMISGDTNQQVTGTVMMRQPSSDPYLLKNIDLEAD